MGTRQDEARRLCPGIVFRAARHDVCVRYHHAILRTAEAILPIDRAWSIDECSCILKGSQQDLAVALDLARQVQRRILQDISPALRCSDVESTVRVPPGTSTTHSCAPPIAAADATTPVPQELVSPTPRSN